MKIDIKPLSVNQCWQGRRFKTKRYKDYEKELLSKLQPLDIPKGNLKLVVNFGVSSKLSDWDNPVKPFQDILQKKYGFDDRCIYSATVNKIIVKKGDEFIDFNITELNKKWYFIAELYNSYNKMKRELIKLKITGIE